MLLDLSGFGIQTHVVFFLDGHAEFECVDGIQTQAFAKQGGCIVDVSGLDILQLENRNDQLLQFLFQRDHASLSPRQKNHAAWY